MHYYQHHIGDFIKDTSFLTNEEVGIYLKLLWIYYDTEQPLPNSLFELSMKVNAREQQDALAGILGMFFTLENNAWHHTRCDKEIEHYHQQLETASRAGKASAAKRAFNKRSTGVEQALELCSTDVQPTNNQQPLTNNQKKTKAVVTAPPDGVSNDVWESFLAIRKAKRAPVTTVALAGIEKEAQKAAMTLEQALAMCCARGWAGFKAAWAKDQVTASEARQNQMAALTRGLATPKPAPAPFWAKPEQTVEVSDVERKRLL